MKTNFSFDTKTLARELKKNIASELKKHPEHLLDNHKGMFINTPCPKCGLNTLTIASGAKAKCSSCNANVKINIELN